MASGSCAYLETIIVGIITRVIYRAAAQLQRCRGRFYRDLARLGNAHKRRGDIGGSDSVRG